MLLLDRKRFETYNVKMKYTCHDIMNVLYKGKNYTVVQWYKDFLKQPRKAEEASEKFLKENLFLRITPRRIKMNITAMEYYTKSLTFIEANLNEDKRQSFIELKEKTINGLQKTPPEYPICVTIHMTNKKADAIDKQYDEWEKKLKASNPEFKVEFNVVKVDVMVLLKSLISPPNTTFFLGLTLAMSKVREIIFGGNIYFDNIVDG